MSHPRLVQPDAQRFQLHGELGRGATATVWLAWDTVRQAWIALKVLHPHLATAPGVQARLRRELRAASRVRHPAALVPFDLHEHDGTLALSLPLHRGATLAERVAWRGRFSAEALRDLVTQISEALAVAHEAGVHHRDISPHNVLIDDRGQPALTDFGLARLGEGASASATGLLGTVGFAAPEAWSGPTDDPRADLYALGACVWLAATGHAPFGDRPTEALRRQLTGDRPPLRHLRPDLPFADLVDRLLQPQPDDRPASARAVLAALQGAPVAPTPTAAPLRLRPLPDGPCTVVVSERHRDRRRRRKLRKVLERTPGLDGAWLHPAEALAAAGWRVFRQVLDHTDAPRLQRAANTVEHALSKVDPMAPERHLAAAVARRASLPTDALRLPPALFEERFRLVDRVDEATAEALVRAAREAGLRATVEQERPQSTSLGPKLVPGVLAIAALLLAALAPDPDVGVVLAVFGGLGLLLWVALLPFAALVRTWERRQRAHLPLAFLPDLADDLRPEHAARAVPDAPSVPVTPPPNPSAPVRARLDRLRTALQGSNVPEVVRRDLLGHHDALRDLSDRLAADLPADPGDELPRLRALARRLHALAAADGHRPPGLPELEARIEALAAAERQHERLAEIGAVADELCAAIVPGASVDPTAAALERARRDARAVVRG